MQKLLATGMIIFLAGLGLLLVGAVAQGGTSAGGVVFIGPLPIVFGSGPSGYDLAFLSVVTGGVMVVLLLLWGLRLHKDERE